jgi:hypothetical protein
MFRHKHKSTSKVAVKAILATAKSQKETSPLLMISLFAAELKVEFVDIVFGED